MDIMIAILIVIGSFAAGIAGNMLANELYDQAPSFARWLIDRAVMQLPDDQRDRYREEWLAHLDELPGSLGKLCHAFDCSLRAARRVATEQKRSHSNLNASEERAEEIAAEIIKFGIKLRVVHMVIPLAIRGQFSKIRLFWRMIDTLLDSALEYRKKVRRDTGTDEPMVEASGAHIEGKRSNARAYQRHETFSVRRRMRA